jgi:hypothetical protein
LEVGFYEDWDGAIILQEVSSFESKVEFMEKAHKYVKHTRGYTVPVLEPVVVDIVVTSDGDWITAEHAEEHGFKGKTLTVYKSDLDWENSDG